MNSFEFLDIYGDAGIKAFGSTLEQAFSNAALGMYSLVTELEDIREERDIEVNVESPSLEGLLVAWLNELTFHLDAYGFVGRRVNIIRLQDCRLSAVVRGEDIDAVRHERKLLIKAATYHKLKIEKTDRGWELEVVFDI